MTNLLTR